MRLCVLVCLLSLSACRMGSAEYKTMPDVKPPQAKQKPHVMTEHGQRRVDEYFWLRDDERSAPDVLEYLHAENAYTDAVLAGQEQTKQTLYDQIIARMAQNDDSVPFKLDEYWYFTRFERGGEYPVYMRHPDGQPDAAEVLVDMNRRARGHDYFHSNEQSISPDHRLIGFSEDTVSRRMYTLRIKDLDSGVLLPDVIHDTSGSIAWAADSRTFFYVRKHPVTLLPYQVFRHELGTPVSDDVLVYEETDNTFYTSCYTSRSRDYIYIHVGSSTQSEVHYLPSNRPRDEFKVFLPREADHEYFIEDFNGAFLITSNWQAKNFRVLRADAADSRNKSAWQEIIAHDDEVLIYDTQAFTDWLAIDQREDGLRQVRLYNWRSGESKHIRGEEGAYTLWTGYNPDPASEEMRIVYESMTTPRSVYTYHLQTDRKTLLKRDRVKGDFDSANYRSERLQVRARDGAMIPVSLVYRMGEPLSGRPLVLYAYGAYGSSVDPLFSIGRLNLLDRGFVFAIAHVRGSQAKGRGWYEMGKLMHKKNTFNDFIDVTRDLPARGYGHADRVFGWGGSAGGLLVGAVANMAGELYRGLIAEVPFVDVVTTMLDEDIPLTTGEFEEWGNPAEVEAYQYMLSYSPYDQVSARDYPNLFVTTGLHDSQVQYWEPAKWVARLRRVKTDAHTVLLRTNMSAGHGGASGRYSQYRELAEIQAFILLMDAAEDAQ